MYQSYVPTRSGNMQFFIKIIDLFLHVYYFATKINNTCVKKNHQEPLSSENELGFDEPLASLKYSFSVSGSQRDNAVRIGEGNFAI